MTANGTLQIVVYLVVLIALAKPLGAYMARIYAGEAAVLNRIGALAAVTFGLVYGLERLRGRQ